MIKCKAIAESSLYLTAGGQFLPCGYVYTNGPYGLPDELKKFSKEENFDSLVETWESENPYPRCYYHCDDKNTASPMHMIHFDKQYINKGKPE
jgi:hypothetical protein